jgi:hypothetical protein
MTLTVVAAMLLLPGVVTVAGARKAIAIVDRSLTRRRTIHRRGPPADNVARLGAHLRRDPSREGGRGQSGTFVSHRCRRAAFGNHVGHAAYSTDSATLPEVPEDEERRSRALAWSDDPVVIRFGTGSRQRAPGDS